MPAFIHTPKGYINLDRVDAVIISEKGRREIVVSGEVVDRDCISFEQTLVAFLPVQGDWECLVTCREDDGSTSLSVEPVIAWGVTVVGALRPITASEPGGVDGDCGLRREGEKRVYDSYSIGGHEDLPDWLAPKPATKNAA